MSAFRKRIGRHGAVLIFLALLDFAWAYGLAFPSERSRNNPTSLFLVGTGAPLWAWAILWAVVGVVCLAAAVIPRHAVGFAAAIFIKILWAMLFLAGWLFAGVERGWVSTAIWAGFGALIWMISRWPDPLRAEP